jgi:hypothetical protein
MFSTIIASHMVWDEECLSQTEVCQNNVDPLVMVCDGYLDPLILLSNFILHYVNILM